MPERPTARQWLSRNARRASFWPLISVAAGGASTLLLFLLAWAIASIVQKMILDDADLSTLTPYLVALPLAFVGRGALSWLKTEAGTRTGILVRQSIRRELLEHLGERGSLWARRQHSATLGNRVWDQVDALQGYYADFRPQILLSGLVPLMILCVVFPLNWAAGLILLLTGPLIPMNMAMVGMGAKQRQEEQFQEMTRMSRHFLDTLRGLTTLKLFGQSRQQGQIIYRVSENFRRKTMRVLRLAFLSSTVLEFFSSVSIALMAIYIGFTYLGQFHFGDWGHGLDLFTGLFILILAPEFYQPLRDLGAHYHAKAEAEAAAEDLIPILEARATPPEANMLSARWQVPNSLGLVLDNIHARYDGQTRYAIEGLTLTLAPGACLAVVGPSGAGKSTLLNVLTGALSPAQGTLSTSDGEDVARMYPGDWQAALGWVGQSTSLLSASLADNLRLANVDASDQTLEAALNEVGLLEWASSLPQGLSTRLGEQGQPVSGGQARRIALARAFVRQAPLILLDEPTASLDQDSERHVMAALSRLKASHTLIILTHRLDLLQLADQVLVLDNGHMRALDTPNNLAGTPGFGPDTHGGTA
ncbi:thiol reductant ABC exporter subunit CydD [Larsenimonas rhizosphaerae]|uniref:Thiol reductant ABC exporter subunit CydD n=1 Tax=Larsenimonas rhizosphaerae TaxID=2944682 RepID=A0AA41ZF56_9GAMM|nr:thiol reductant ABC exporter subunit CydD [Larsenimonas rhizosphaerae]MCX2523034.1 thiol reductant ABC exporter subunit CydD [Larsenimonas rhizosphaerae]